MPRTREFFYLEKRLKRDANLHEPTLDGGDDAVAREISDKIAAQLGLTANEIAALQRPIKRPKSDKVA